MKPICVIIAGKACYHILKWCKSKNMTNNITGIGQDATFQRNWVNTSTYWLVKHMASHFTVLVVVE